VIGTHNSSIGANLLNEPLLTFDSIRSNCSPLNPSQPLHGQLPLHLRLLLWDCPSECDYICQRQLTSTLRSQDAPLHQFHGKWPFLRLWGIQEPCSVLFSIFNFHGYYRGLGMISKRVPDTYPLKPYYIILSIFGMNAWLWSTIFHTRDFLFTERADYFSAGASIMYGLFYTPLRLFDIHWRDPKQVRPFIYIWAGICILAFFAHVYYLSFVVFSYSYNMAANVAIGMIQNLLWIAFSLSRWRSNRGSWVWIPTVVVVYVMCAMSLELFDFFPILDALDAHSLWHVATVPMVCLLLLASVDLFRYMYFTTFC
jgi:post-GPI attachment to proteins factor 3